MATGRSAPQPIDPRGPRTNQAVLATGLLIGFLTGQSWVVPLFGVVLLLGVAFGPTYGPVLRFFQVVIRPRLAPPAELEDPRPPRFAATVGVVFLTASTISFAIGAAALAWVLALMVAALAGLAAITGICVGCEMYVLWVRARGGVRVVTIEREMHESVAAGERRTRHGSHPALPASLLDGRPTWVVFSTEFCAVCPGVVEQIQSARPDDHVVVLDVAEHLDLASAYKVRRAPTVLRADIDGRVEVRLAGADAVRSELRSVVATTLA